MEASKIISKAARGDAASSEKLYRQYKNRAFFAASVMARDHAEAITEKAFSVAFLGLSRSGMKTERDFERATAGQLVSLAGKAVGDMSSDAAASGDLASEGEDMVKELVQGLPPRQRFAMVLTGVFRFGDSESAALMGMDRSEYSAIYKKALENVKKRQKELMTLNAARYGKLAGTDVPTALGRMAIQARSPETMDARIIAAVEKAPAKKKNIIIAAACGAAVALAVILCIVLFGGEKTPVATGVEPPIDVTGHEIHHVEIEIADYGTIALAVDSTVAPITAANFLKLAGDGFYDGLTFHRIIDGFMMQGGCPDGNGRGGSGEYIKGEFASNGVQNDLIHTRGILSMARGTAPNTASSQFFIMHATKPHLDGNYAAFGWVTSGMEVVDEICTTVPVIDLNGTVKDGYQPVITAVRVID